MSDVLVDLLAILGYGTGRGVKVYHVAQLHCCQTIIFLSSVHTKSI